MKTFYTLFIALLHINIATAQSICGNVAFPEESSRITLPLSIGAEIGTNEFTVEFWINGEEFEQGQHPTVLSNRDGSKGLSILFHDNWGGSEFKMICFNFENSNFINTECPLILDGSCRHVAIKREENALKYYLDGDYIYKRVIPAHFSWDSSEKIILGGDRVNSSATPLFAELDELKLWTRALSDAEISETLYRELIPGEDAEGLLAHYRFLGSSDVILDESGNNLHGMLGGEDSNDTNAERQEDICCAPIVIINQNETAFSTSFEIFPNPANDQLVIEIEDQGDYEYHFTNTLGQVILSGSLENTNATINTTLLTPGLYFFQLATNGKSAVKSIVIE